jgi:hypothetical protein
MFSENMTSNVLEYNNIKQILGFTANVIGETNNLYFHKEFRYSSDGILWSDYKQLTNDNLSNITIYDGTVYIQYRFTQIGSGTLYINSISLDVDYNTDIEKSVIPECFWNPVEDNSSKIVFDTGSKNMFNPYAIGQGIQMYTQLSALFANMFGFCVLYFKTEANSRTRDVVLKEYSIEKVVAKDNVKILMPDNQFPTKELQFNSMMLDMPVQFEVHVVKSEFQKVFGKDSHPDPHDYLYFQKYLNKMYMVDSVSEPDVYMYESSYWRVSLVPYQEFASVQYDDESLLEDTESLIFSAEGKFGEEVQEEFEDIRKDNQLNDLGDFAEGQDFLRECLEPNLRIDSENIYNKWTVVSKQHYRLSTIERGKKVVTYRYKDSFSNNDERMISFWFRPHNVDKNISDNILLNEISESDKGIKVGVKKWSDLFQVGNYVKLTRTGSANGYRQIVEVNKGDGYIIVKGKYDMRARVMNCAKLVAYGVNTPLYIGDGFSVEQNYNSISLNIGNKHYDFTFDNFERFENRWYAVVIGLNKGISNIWLYDLVGSDKKDNIKSELKLISCSSNEIGKFNVNGNECGLMSCDQDFTNFRLWDKICEQELHDLILSQYVVDDSHNTLIVDNAQQELLLHYKWS